MNTKVFKKEQEQATYIGKQISNIDILEENGLIIEVDINRRIALKVNLQNIALLEPCKWRQLCKYNWLNDGHKNLSFFPEIVMARRPFNFISEIQSINGGNYYYFIDIYTDNIDGNQMIGNLDWHRLILLKLSNSLFHLKRLKFKNLLKC